MSEGPLRRGLKLLAAALFPRRRSDNADAGSEVPRVPPASEPETPTEQRETGSDPRAVAVTAALLAATIACLIGFVVFYVVFPDTQVLGLCMGLGLVAFGIALAIAGKQIVPREKATEPYEDLGDRTERAEAVETAASAGDGVSRRKLLLGLGGAAAATAAGAALVPVASIGPSVGERVFASPWRAGRRVVDIDDEPLIAAEIEEATFYSAFPEAAEKGMLASSLIIVRLPVAELELSEERRAGAPEGILAFSKICPHAGCAVSMYRHPLHEPTAPNPALVCPCHYSTFDPARGGALEFGPAGRDLPQLPLDINAAGELVSAGDFLDPVGPSYSGIRRTD